jgi:hypothetical protein
MFDHQMYIQRQTCFFAYEPHNVRSKRNIIDEMAVHNIAVNPIGACGFDAMNFLSEPGEICRKNGRRNDNSSHEMME